MDNTECLSGGTALEAQGPFDQRTVAQGRGQRWGAVVWGIYCLRVHETRFNHLAQILQLSILNKPPQTYSLKAASGFEVRSGGKEREEEREQAGRKREKIENYRQVELTWKAKLQELLYPLQGGPEVCFGELWHPSQLSESVAFPTDPAWWWLTFPFPKMRGASFHLAVFINAFERGMCPVHTQSYH